MSAAAEGFEHAAGVGFGGGFVENFFAGGEVGDDDGVGGEDDWLIADFGLPIADFILDGAGFYVGEADGPEIGGDGGGFAGGFGGWGDEDGEGDVGFLEELGAARGGGGEDERMR